MSNYSEFDKKGYTVTATDFVITHNGYTLSLVSVEHRMDDCAELYVEIKDENGAPVKAAEGYISNFDFAPNFADVQNKNDVINLVNYTRKTGSVVAEINQAMVDALKSFTKSNPSNDGFF
jgi:hypothetical protein